MKAFRPVLFLALILLVVGLACSALTGGGDTPPPPVVTEEPVQPVLLDFCGEGSEIAWIGEETAPHNAWRVLCRREIIPVRVRVLEPFDPAQCNDRKEIAATARELRHDFRRRAGHVF